MSPNRIVIGFFIAGCSLLAAGLAAFWYFGFPAKWIPIVPFVFVALGGGLLLEMQRRKALRPYWERACMGIRWTRRFPDVPKTEIREFLNLFVVAFALRTQRRC